jgi:large conductance mechanosensitive channel
MRIMKEFQEFAMKWNVVDLAVWVVIGGAFGKIVSSLVSDIIMPIVGFLTAWVDVKDLAYQFEAPTLDWTTKIVDLKWGMFIQSMIDFIIIAFAIFIFIKIINKAMKKKPQTAPVVPAGPTDIELLTEIRDLLKTTHKFTKEL